jgi:hypothetical protein
MLLRLYWQPVALAGSLAHLLQPVANIKPLEDPTRHFVVIMKDGKIFKNTLTKLAPSSTAPR